MLPAVDGWSMLGSAQTRRMENKGREGEKGVNEGKCRECEDLLQIFATIRSSLNDYVYVSRLESRMNHLKQFKDSNGRFKSG